MAEKMRLALGQMKELSDERLAFAAQLGIKDVQMNRPSLPGEKHWDFRDLLLARTRAEDAGLRLAAIENVPFDFLRPIQLGWPNRDEMIEHYQETIRNMGRAGIPILGYSWAPDGVWRTSRATAERGGAKVTAFEYDLVKDAPLTYDREYSEAEIWANYEYFIRAVVPVAEQAGVTLALHPNDPPVASLGGVPRIFRSFDSFKRAMAIVDSPNSGLNFCQGTWAEMGTDVFEAIRYFGSRGKIVYVHFRNVTGHVPSFRESFVNTGDVNMYEALKLYKAVGFTGFLMDDHVPHLDGDSDWGHRSRAYAFGYIQALIEVVNGAA